MSYKLTGVLSDIGVSDIQTSV